MPRVDRIWNDPVARRRWPLFSSLPLALVLGIGSGLALISPARALVPYVYVPQSQELEGVGLGIAQAASRLLRLGQAEDAARLAELMVQLLPDDPRGWVLLAEAELRSNHTAKAITALSKAKQLDPRNPGIWFAEGALALRNGKPQEAVGLLRRGLQLDARNSGAYFDLGNAQLLLGDSSQALASYEKAASLRKDFWEAVNNQALVLFESGRRDVAIDRWRRVLKIKPGVPEPSLALAAALLQASPSHRAEAVRLTEGALAEEPSYVLDSYQKDQLWGPKLRGATRVLLTLPELKAAVERAQANASPGGESQE